MSEENVESSAMLERRSFLKLCGAGIFVLAGGSYLSLTGCAAPAAPATPAAPTTKTVIDLSGRSVVIPADPQHIAALLGNSVMRVLFLDAMDRVAYATSLGTSPWLAKIYPNLNDKNITYLEAAGARDPNAEELAQAGVDLIYYWNDLPDVVERFEKLEIPTLCTNPSSKDFKEASDWIKVVTEEMDAYANSLGDAAAAKAKKWLTYANETVNYISAKTKNIAEADKPRVYYIRSSESGLQAFAKGSFPLVAVNLGGGHLVTDQIDTSGGFTDVTIEQVIEWNPEVVFMGWRTSTDAIAANPQFSSIDAVQNNKVYLNPTSIASTGWAYDGEAPLEMLYVAKTLHPDLFTDLDLPTKVKDFYKEFRDADITLAEAQLMLDHKNPA
jgi:iron complex transport system substrate-binding protein